MSALRPLRAATFLLLLLLAGIVLSGELNRRLDRSAGIEVSAAAEARTASPYSGARLRLSGALFEARPVDAARFSAGAAVTLRYGREGSEWRFLEAAPGKPESWTASRLDVPARVERSEYSAGLRATPLVPSEFAIPDRIVSRIRGGSRLLLRLRRGALGNVWVEAATRTADSLGEVAAILPDPHGPLVFGAPRPGLGPREFTTERSEGWVAQVSDLRMEESAELPGEPVDAVVLPDGRIALFARGRTTDGFDLYFIGRDRRPSPEVRHYGGTLEAVGTDGSFWTAQKAGPRGRRLVRRDVAGNVLREADFPGSGWIEDAWGDVVVTRDSGVVARYDLSTGSAVETDRWLLDGIEDARLLEPAAIVAGARKGAYLLRAGEKEPSELFLSGPSRRVTRAFVADGRDVLLAMEPKGALAYIPFGGKAQDLGELQTSRSALALWESPHVASHRFVVAGGLLFYAGSGEIDVFDLGTGTLRARIEERPAHHPERIL